MPGGGSLTVTLDAPTRLPDQLGGHYGPWVRVVVRDEGIGISEEDLGRVFDPYFTTKPAGSGLGLASAYAIVRKHRGFITVSSELGQGTTFELFLPAESGVVAVTPMADDPTLRRFVGRMLVVDDEPAIRVLAKRMFASLGLEVVACVDGEAGILSYQWALEANEPFDLVLLDLTIPGGMGGQEAVQRILALDPEAVGEDRGYYLWEKAVNGALEPSQTYMTVDTTDEALGTMLDAIEAGYRSRPEAPFEERLMLALEAGRDAGGQHGGQNSAALLVYAERAYARVDLRVDVHGDAVTELRRVYARYLPYRDYYALRADDPANTPAQDAFARDHNLPPD